MLLTYNKNYCLEKTNIMPKKLTKKEMQDLKVARLQIKLLPTELMQLAALENKLHMSRTEVVRHSLALFDWVAKEALAGRTFGTFDADAKVAKEVVIPALAGLAGHEQG